MSTQNEPTIEDLIAFGYAPGNYMGKCRDCGKTEWGRDKRAWRCKGCATERWREKQEAKDNMSTQEEQQPLVDRLREGCIINPKRWSGDPGEPSPVNESATEELLMEAADEIERLRAIEAQAIEQSEHVQREWLSPSEAEGLKREVERLRAELDRARWIPVTEKLPEVDNERDGYSEWVLAYDGTIECACYDPASGMWATSNEYLLHVTHWMPLPPPPTQEAQEE